MDSQDDLEKAGRVFSASTIDVEHRSEHIRNRQIRYDDEEGERFEVQRRRRSRSCSIHSVRSARASRYIEPAVALPIHYRTLSYNIQDGDRRPKQTEQVKRNSKQKFWKRSETKQTQNADQFADVEWHTLSEAEICQSFGTDILEGLSSEQIQKARAQYGQNIQPSPPSRLLHDIFWYMFGGFGTILLLGSILVFVSWKPLGSPPALANLALAIVLVAVFVLQAAFNAWQDFSSSRVMKSITGMIPEECHALRDGQKHTLQASELVPGDILLYKAGSKLPADVRFLEVSTDSKFDRSILTGEAAPLAAVTESTDPNYLETRNMGFAGTHCTTGSGSGIVVATGANTVFGHIAKLTSTPSTEPSPLQKEIRRFVTIIVSLMLTMNIVVIGVWAGYIRQSHPGYMPVASLIVNVVSVAIAFIPEGLPITLTTTLTITANIMRKNNILCKSLKTVETLGAVSVLLSDKTGTLTKNQMTVTDVLLGTAKHTTECAKRMYGAGETAKSALEQMRIIAAVNNAGEFDPTTMHKPLVDRKIIADATDAAVLRLSETMAPVSDARKLWRKRFDLPFNSRNKFAIRVCSPEDPRGIAQTLGEAQQDSFDEVADLLMTIKGAPDVLLPRCSTYVNEDGQVNELSDNVQTTIESVKDEWSSRGRRVLLLARKVLRKSSLVHNPEDGEFESEVLREASMKLTIVGLVGIVDPPRDEVPHVIRTLRQAGIRTMMVTGDFKLTARAIAQQCGIITVDDRLVDDITSLPLTLNDNNNSAISEEKIQPRALPARREAIVLSGPELNGLTDNQWSILTTYDSIVFARTTPDQKLRIVREFKARHHIVAMTGDGVNDAPSLKEADVGVAPGSASEIALEAADMILLESFEAIVSAVLQGRTVFENLRKSIAYLLPAGSFSEFWPVMTSVVFGLPQILSSFLMIIICCFTDCAAAITLAFEKPEADVMLRPPRDPRKDRLVDWKFFLQSFGFIGIIECVCSFAVSFWWLQTHGVPFSCLWFSFGDYSCVPNNMAPDEVSARLNTASSIYFVNLVVMQWFNIMAVRTRRLSILQHPPLFNKKTRNWYIFPAIVFALVIIFIFCYIPGVQDVIDSAQIPVAQWFMPFAFGAGLLCLDELRKFAVRRWPKGVLARIAW